MLSCVVPQLRYWKELVYWAVRYRHRDRTNTIDTRNTILFSSSPHLSFKFFSALVATESALNFRGRPVLKVRAGLHAKYSCRFAISASRAESAATREFLSFSLNTFDFEAKVHLGMDVKGVGDYE
eukprot:5298249-Pyramimonas_sp.AAC.2